MTRRAPSASRRRVSGLSPRGSRIAPIARPSRTPPHRPGDLRPAHVPGAPAAAPTSSVVEITDAARANQHVARPLRRGLRPLRGTPRTDTRGRRAHCTPVGGASIIQRHVRRVIGIFNERSAVNGAAPHVGERFRLRPRTTGPCRRRAAWTTDVTEPSLTPEGSARTRSRWPARVPMPEPESGRRDDERPRVTALSPGRHTSRRSAPVALEADDSGDAPPELLWSAGGCCLTGASGSNDPGMSTYRSSPGAATTPASGAVGRADDAAVRLRQVPPGARARTSSPGQARVSRRRRMQRGEGAPVEGPSVHARRAYGGTAPGWWRGFKSFPDPPDTGWWRGRPG